MELGFTAATGKSQPSLLSPQDSPRGMALPIGSPVPFSAVSACSNVSRQMGYSIQLIGQGKRPG